MSEQRRMRRKRTRIIGLIIAAVVIIGGGLTFFLLTREPSDSVDNSEPEIQTATVRQGDISLKATGAGILTAGDKVIIGFDTEGALAEIYVKEGDSVEAGDPIARLDDTNAQKALTIAEQDLAELTSPLAIAETRVKITNIEKELLDARNTLAYLISPEVLYYEEKLAEAEEDLEAATGANDEKAIASAETAIMQAQNNLSHFQYVYQSTYIPDTFTVEEQDEDNPGKTIEVVYAPTDYAINNARNMYNYKLEEMKALKNYLTALETGQIPEGAVGTDISRLRSALRAVEAAQEDLEKCVLVAPITGVVTELTAKVGEKSNSSFVTILDLYHPYLDIYLDASDWDMVDLDYDVEVEFDAYPGLILTGKVTQIDSFLTNTGMASLIYGQVTLDEESLEKIADLLIGSEGTVDIIKGSAENAILVPVEALHKVGDQYSVFVVVDGEMEVRFVEVGLIDTYYAEILSGLEVGEVVSTGIVETN
ncbi:HlyD family efflux transporter periplasmic adaptor subunit [Chloroflexota bacterium]|nr:HlyD family efflux transporter periplasmic adaptor subunit [Chloroflexota bacterium]